MGDPISIATLGLSAAGTGMNVLGQIGGQQQQRRVLGLFAQGITHQCGGGVVALCRRQCQGPGDHQIRLLRLLWQKGEGFVEAPQGEEGFRQGAQTKTAAAWFARGEQGGKALGTLFGAA